MEENLKKQKRLKKMQEAVGLSDDAVRHVGDPLG